MKKFLATLTLLKGLRGAKKTAAYNYYLGRGWKGLCKNDTSCLEGRLQFKEAK